MHTPTLQQFSSRRLGLRPCLRITCQLVSSAGTQLNSCCGFPVTSEHPGLLAPGVGGLGSGFGHSPVSGCLLCPWGSAPQVWPSGQETLSCPLGACWHLLHPLPGGFNRGLASELMAQDRKARVPEEQELRQVKRH